MVTISLICSVAHLCILHNSFQSVDLFIQIDRHRFLSF